MILASWTGNDDGSASGLSASQGGSVLRKSIGEEEKDDDHNTVAALLKKTTRDPGSINDRILLGATPGLIRGEGMTWRW